MFLKFINHLREAKVDHMIEKEEEGKIVKRKDDLKLISDFGFKLWSLPINCWIYFVASTVFEHKLLHFISTKNILNLIAMPEQVTTGVSNSNFSCNAGTSNNRDLKLKLSL